MRILASAIFLLLAPLALGAQEVGVEPQPTTGEPLKVSLITIGQGDRIWERFGHNALMIENEETGYKRFFNWGVFSWDEEGFYPRLFRGTMLFRLDSSDPETALMGYQREGRPVWIQELFLTPFQRQELLALVQENDLPENRYYRYDYYRDNCSTRVRDMLDRVLDGQLETLFSAHTMETTFRWHTRRLLKELPLSYLGIQFVLGPRSDHFLTAWEEMFLPMRLMSLVQDVQVPDGEGGVRSFATEEKVLLDPGRSDPPSAPPFALPLFLAVGLLWGGGLLWLAGTGSGLGAGRRLGVSLLACGWSLVAAVAGSLMLVAWLFTDHVFWYQNFNLLQANPLSFAVSVAFPLFLVRGRFPRWGRDFAVGVALISVMGFAVELLPGLGQGNSEILPLTLPVNLSVGAVTARLYQKASKPS